MEEKNEVIKQKTAELIVPDEQQLYTDVYSILQQAREKAYNSANGIMTYAYWNIGRRIVEQEQYGTKKVRYGSYLIKNLSIQLSDEFGTGFSVANLKNCRRFYLTFPQDSYGYSIADKIPWSHLRSIMRISDEEEIRNPLTIVSCLLIKAAQRTGMLLNYKPPTSPQATSPRPSPNWLKASRRAINSRLY